MQSSTPALNKTSARQLGNAPAALSHQQLFNTRQVNQLQASQITAPPGNPQTQGAPA
jgi:hypothetical protein